MKTTDDDATIPVTHHATLRERRAELLAAGKTSRHPECVVIGHAWVEDRGREGWFICLACAGVRPP